MPEDQKMREDQQGAALPATGKPMILHPAVLAAVNRGNGATTTPLVTRERGATTFLNGITTFEPGASIGLHTHNCVESVMVIQGDAIVDINGDETPLTLFDTTLVPADVPHRFRNASATQPMRILWTYGSVEATRTLLETGVTGRIDHEHSPDGSD